MKNNLELEWKSKSKDTKNRNDSIMKMVLRVHAFEAFEEKFK